MISPRAARLRRCKGSRPKQGTLSKFVCIFSSYVCFKSGVHCCDHVDDCLKNQMLPALEMQKCGYAERHIDR